MTCDQPEVLLLYSTHEYGLNGITVIYERSSILLSAIMQLVVGVNSIRVFYQWLLSLRDV